MKSIHHIPVTCRGLKYVAQVDDLPAWTLEDLVEGIGQAARRAATQMGKAEDYFEIAGCISGGEAGVDMADRLSERLGVRSNGTQGDWANRRDKKVQVRAARGSVCARAGRRSTGTDLTPALLARACLGATATSLQQDLVRRAGLRAVRQACGGTWEEVEDFLRSETFPVVSALRWLVEDAGTLGVAGPARAASEATPGVAARMSGVLEVP